MAGMSGLSIQAGIPYRARRNFQLKDGLELVEGDIVEIIGTDESTGWWTGIADEYRISKGQRGYVLPSDIEPLSGPYEAISSSHDAMNTASTLDPWVQDTICEPPATVVPENEASSPLSASLPSPPTTPRLSSPVSRQDDTKSPNSPIDLDAGGYQVAPTLVRALFDVDALNEGDLSYKRDDIIEVEVRSTAEVWQGRVGDKTGDFRLDYTVEPIITDRVRALFDYKSDTPEDLALKGGDIIQVIGRSNHSNWWLHGWMEGQGIGLFPFNFIEPLKHDYEDSDDEETPNIVRNSLSKRATKIRVLNDVKSTEKGMLSLKRGDVLELVERQTPEKWIGRLKSQTGWFNLDNTVEPIMTERVKAIHSYSSKDSEELQFSANDIIDVVGPTDDSTWWWYGTVQGKFGMFPFNFVETIPDLKRADTDPNDLIEVTLDEIPKMMRASYNFHSKDPSDLSFEKGDVIKVLDSTDPQWWEGEINDRTGMFPRSYCEPMAEDAEHETSSHAEKSSLPILNDLPTATAHSRPSLSIPASSSAQPKGSPVLKAVRAIRDSHLSGDPEELKFRAGDVIEVVDMPSTTMWWKGRLEGKTGIFPADFVEDIPEMVPTIAHLSPITEISEAITPLSAITSAASDNLPWNPCFARALYNFTGQPGDLTFLKGDVIEIINMYHADWWRGKLREQVGNIPRNYVELVVIPNTSRTPTLALSFGTSISSVSDTQISRSKSSGIILPLTEEPSAISEGTGSHESLHQSLSSSAYPVGTERVRAIHPWNSGKPRELIVETGDVIRVLTRPMEHWWRGVLEKNYSVGLFPAKIVEAVPDESARSSWSIVSRKQRDEAAVTLRSNIAKLRPLLENFDCTTQDIADDAQIQKLFKDSCVLKRKLVRSLSEHSTSNDEILSLETSFEEIRTLYDSLLTASAAKHWETAIYHGFMNPPKRLTDVSKGPSTLAAPVGNLLGVKSNTVGPTSAEISASTSAPLSLGPQRRNTGGSVRSALPPTPSPVLRPARDSFQKYEGRISGIALEIERAREAYSSNKSIGRSNSTRHLPVSPATILSILRPGKSARPSSGESVLKKTIYKPSVEYQHVHVVHANVTAPKRTR